MKKKNTGVRVANRKREVEHITTMTLDEARKRIAAGESQTDWARVDALTDADIDRAIASDPNAAPRLGKWFWDNAELLSVAAAAEKIPVTLRIDRDVVRCFKELGPGYQSRMNAVLRAYANAHANKKAE